MGFFHGTIRFSELCRWTGNCGQMGSDFPPVSYILSNYNINITCLSGRNWEKERDQALPNWTVSTTPCPGSCHFYSGLLQCSSGSTYNMCNQTSTYNSEWSSVSPREPTSHLYLFLSNGYQLLLASISRHWCFLIQNSHRLAPFHIHSLSLYPLEACCTKPVSIANLLILRLNWARFSGSKGWIGLAVFITMVTMVCARYTVIDFWWHCGIICYFLCFGMLGWLDFWEGQTKKTQTDKGGQFSPGVPSVDERKDCKEAVFHYES